MTKQKSQDLIAELGLDQAFKQLMLIPFKS